MENICSGGKGRLWLCTAWNYGARKAEDELTKSRRSPGVGEENFFGLSWLILSWDWGKTLNKLSAIK